jgi:hypothetical protein
VQVNPNHAAAKVKPTASAAAAAAAAGAFAAAGFAVRIVRTNITNPVRNISIVPAAAEFTFADQPYQASFLELVKGEHSSSSSSRSIESAATAAGGVAAAAEAVYTPA